MKKALFLALMIGLILSSCTRDKSINFSVEDGAFAVFLVDNEEELMLSSLQVRLEDMHLAPTPLFTSSDINYYQWSTHQIQIKESRCPIPIDLMRHHFFVVTVGLEKIYYGEFVLDIMSKSVDRPVIRLMPGINDGGTPYFLECLCRIEAGYPWPSGGQLDLRPDQRIYDALKKAGKLI
jgi:hypothetical protein